jgi:diguanylate cyclase
VLASTALDSSTPTHRIGDLAMAGRSGPNLMSFDEACAQVVCYLKEWVPLAFWSVSRVDGERQVHLYVQDDAYGISAGSSAAWSESFCQYMVAGVAPQIAPDAMAVPRYAEAGRDLDITIGAYVGVPIHDGDGTLFGTLCGLDPVVQDDDLLQRAPLLHLLATLLGQILHAGRLRAIADESEAQLRWNDLHDPLTGLPNRAMLLDLLGGAPEPDADRARGVLLLDIDDFAVVNDTLGHATGDRLLMEVAGRLSAAFGPADTVARLGGDEFAVLLAPGGDDLPGAAARAAAVFDEPVVIDGRHVPVSVHVGAAAITTSDVDDVLSRVDIARRIAQQRQARVTLYDPSMTLPGTRDLQLHGPLRDALRAGTIDAAYQPIVELDSGRVVAFEALARWTHDGVAVPPDVFIPVAERGNLLPQLTDHMLDLAAAQVARWSAALGHRRLQVAVNVPPGLITDPAFPGRVEECMQRHGLGPRQLILEITEDALLTDPPVAQAVANQLNEVGATLSLDDFGTGYSSLLHLQQIPLQSVKIDRGFTADLEASPAARRFMRAVLALGRDLGLNVVVEGVERATQADIVHGLFGTHAQGHYFGRPARAEDIDVRPDHR